jgi:LysR family transcriptional regulator for bpeEF and oprC
MLVASPDYLARAGTPTDPDDLLKHSCVRFFNPNTGKTFEWAFNRDGERKVVPVTGRLLVSDIGSMTTAAVAGAGIAPAISFLAERPLAAGLLTRVLPDWQLEGQRPVSALYLKGRHPSPKVQAFIDFLVTLFPTPDGRTHPRSTR